MSSVSLFKTEYTTIENIEQLSNKLGEPEWLLQRRKRAFESFLDLPYDQDTLFYKYTNFRKLDPQKLTPMWEIEETNVFPKDDSVPTSIELDSSIQIKLNDEMKSKGVILMSIQDLVKTDEDLAKKIITKIDSFSDNFDKLGLLARTFAINTLVLYVPKGVILEKPIFKEIYNTQGAFNSFNEFIGYFEQDTQLEIREIFRNIPETKSSADQVYTSMNTLYLEDNSNVKHSQVQAWEDNVLHIMSKVVNLQNYAKLVSLTHLQGGQMTRQNSLINLTGRGSEGYDLFINFGNERQRFDVKSNCSSCIVSY
ncbi:MAG: SufD family Fe-S cluster assembly protein [Candidatus Heimdallarchaeota archaeon]